MLSVSTLNAHRDIPKELYGPCGTPHATRAHACTPSGRYPGTTDPAKLGGKTVDPPPIVVVAWTSAQLVPSSRVPMQFFGPEGGSEHGLSWPPSLSRPQAASPVPLELSTTPPVEMFSCA